jgi:hypothetical protein
MMVRVVGVLWVGGWWVGSFGGGGGGFGVCVIVRLCWFFFEEGDGMGMASCGGKVGPVSSVGSVGSVVGGMTRMMGLLAFFFFFCCMHALEGKRWVGWVTGLSSFCFSASHFHFLPRSYSPCWL